jgi:hypothetical protein
MADRAKSRRWRDGGNRGLSPNIDAIFTRLPQSHLAMIDFRLQPLASHPELETDLSQRE